MNCHICKVKTNIWDWGMSHTEVMCKKCRNTFLLKQLERDEYNSIIQEMKEEQNEI